MTRFTCGLWAVLVLGLALFSGLLRAQGGETPTAPVSSEKLTLDTLFGSLQRAMMATPIFTWLPDGNALILDRSQPDQKPVLEKLEPATGKRSPALDSARAMDSLKSLLTGKEEAPPVLGMPEEIDNTGHWALYEIADDVFALDLSTSVFRRVTRTAGEEKCAHFSPDGRHVSFVRDNNLFVADLISGKEKPLTRDGSAHLLNGTLSWVYWEEVFGREDSAYWWSPDGAAIAFFKSDESKVSESVFSGIEPATPEVMRQRYPKAGGLNPVVKLCLVEVSTGKVTAVNILPPEPEYIFRVNWLPDSKSVSLQVANRKQNEVRLLFADRRTGQTRLVLTETNPCNVSPQDDLRFLSDGQRFLWASERDGHNHLYLYDIQGKLIRQLTKGDMMVRSSSGLAWVHGGVCAVDEKGGWVYFTAITTAPLAPQLYRVPLEGGEAVRVSSGNGSHRVSFSLDARYYFDAYSSGSQPPSLTLRRANGDTLAILATPRNDLVAKYDLSFAEYMTIPAGDGFPLPASLIKPKGFDPAKKYPVLIYVYGGPSAPVVLNAWNRDLYFGNILAANGYIYISIDNRSATGLSKTLENEAHGKMLASREVADIVAAVRWLKAQSWVDPGRVGVWGWSGGGTFTLALMSQSKEFKAGIAVAAVSDFRYYDTVFAESHLGRPQDNQDGYDASAPALTLKNLSGKLLLVHGTFDDNVHPQNAWRAARELQEAGILFEMMIYPMENHGIGSPKVRKHVYQVMLDFWLRNL